MTKVEKEKNNIFLQYPKITIVLTVIISVLVLDVFLTNIYNYRKKQTQREIIIDHPVYHLTFKKNSNNSGSYYGNQYTLFTNSLGFKDKSSRKVQLKSQNHRILFIGDSFTEGQMLNYEDTFVGLIDLALGKKNIEVLNSSNVSYSPIIYWRKIKYLIENVGLQFNEVVVFIDISDVKEESQMYELSDDMSVKLKTETRLYRPPRTKLTKLKNFIFLNTTIIYSTLNFIHDSLGFNEEVEQSNSWSQFISSKNDLDKWTIDNDVYSAYGKEGIVLMKKYMNKLLKLLRDNKIDLTIAVYPWPSQIWYEDLNSIQVDIWKKWSKKNNVKFINYFPNFVVKGIDNVEKNKIFKKYYIPRNVHFNKEGNRIIANKFIELYYSDK